MWFGKVEIIIDRFKDFLRENKRVVDFLLI
jgi:hypothetical protein